MTDHELLEMAAKAAGGLVYLPDMGWIYEDEQGNRGAWWNPLTNDGDAFRLAVNLRMDITFNDTDVFAWPPNGEQGHSEELNNGDNEGATRRTITRAAAEIGKQSS